MLQSKIALKQKKEAAALAVDGEVTGVQPLEVDPIHWGDGLPARAAAELLARVLTVSAQLCSHCALWSPPANPQHWYAGWDGGTTRIRGNAWAAWEWQDLAYKRGLCNVPWCMPLLRRPVFR
jgi:hypothetical protein